MILKLTHMRAMGSASEYPGKVLYRVPVSVQEEVFALVANSGCSNVWSMARAIFHDSAMAQYLEREGVELHSCDLEILYDFGIICDGTGKVQYWH